MSLSSFSSSTVSSSSPGFLLTCSFLLVSCHWPPGFSSRSPPVSSPAPVNSYGDDEEDDSSSSDSEEEVLRQFEISVSRSQSFRASTKSERQTRQLSLGRRQKFNRLSDQEEGSTEPSDCEGASSDPDVGTRGCDTA